MENSGINPSEDTRQEASEDSAKSGIGQHESAADANETLFFSVGVAKLLILNILSFHYYTFLWIYKNWKYLRDKRGRRVQPILRSIFSSLFVWQLFAEMSETVVEEGGKPALINPALMAIFYIIFVFAANFGSRNIDPLYSFLVFGGVVPTILIQIRVNELNSRRSIVSNTRFSKWNWTFIVVSSLFWALCLLSSFA